MRIPVRYSIPVTFVPSTHRPQWTALTLTGGIYKVKKSKVSAKVIW